jgi:malonyl-CoA/methylmalonyl-CoA synthetase
MTDLPGPDRLAPGAAEAWRRHLGEAVDAEAFRRDLSEGSLPHDGPRKFGSVGLPLPGTELTVVDDEGRCLGPGEDGEIVLRGPQVFSGYLDLPDATREAFYPGGWFRTGDIGRVDPEDGYLTITGRSKELIISGGLNVYPREIELVVEEHPTVEKAAVVRAAGEEARAGPS